MLQSIRRHAKGWIATLIVGVLAIAFSLWGIQNYLDARGSHSTVAKVNGETINQTQLRAAYQQLKQQLQAQFGENLQLKPEMQKELKQQALQRLIHREVVSQAASSNGFRISPQQLTAVIQQMPSFQIDGQFSPERYHRVLSSLNYSDQHFIEELEQSLLIGQLQTGIQGTAFALPSEVKQAVVLSEQTRDFDYVTISTKPFQENLKISDEEVSKYYQDNSAEFQQSAQVSLNYVELSAEEVKKKLTIPEQDIKDYYQNNLMAFSKPAQVQVRLIKVDVDESAGQDEISQARQKIDGIKKELDGGKAFDSFNPTKAQWFATDRFNAHIIKAVADLKVGEYSEAAASTGGFFIAKLMARKEPEAIPFEQVKEKVKQAVTQQKLDQQFLQLNDQLTELAFTSPDSLEAIEKDLNLEQKTTELFGAQGGNTPVTQNQKVIEAAFSDEVLHDRTNSSVIEISPGVVVVVRVKEYVAAKPVPLTEVKEDIIDTLKQQAAAVKAQKLGEEILEKIKSKQNIDDIIKQNNLTLSKKTEATRQQPSINNEVLRLAFQLPDPAVSKHVSVSGAQLSNGDYALVRVQKVNLPKDLKLSQQQQRVFDSALSMGFGKLEFDLLVNGLIKNADIKMIDAP